MTTRDRMVIIVVLALGAVVAAWMLVVLPKRDQAASLSSQITTEQRQFDTARNQLAAGRPRATRSLAGTRSSPASVRRFLPMMTSPRSSIRSRTPRAGPKWTSAASS